MLKAVAITCLLLVIRSARSYFPEDDGMCPQYTIDAEGEAKAPEYGIDLDVINGFHCTYNFKAKTDNQVVVLEFTDFQLHDPMYTEKLNYDKYEVGCEKEFVEIYRDSSKKTEKERYCGKELKQRTITSTAREMKFIFNKYYTDKTSKGFIVKVSFVDKGAAVNPCKEMFSKQTDVTIPRSAETCVLSAKGPVGQAATVTVTGVNPAQQGTDCNERTTWVDEMTPAESAKGELPTCGSNIAGNSYKAYTNALSLRIIPRTAEIRARIAFNPRPFTCGGQVNMQAGSTQTIKLPEDISVPVHNELSCVWTITIPNNARGLKINYRIFNLAAKTGNTCANDQFYSVEFRENDIGQFLQRRAGEANIASCASDLKTKTVQFTAGKTVYLFLSMNYKIDYDRDLEADLSLL